MADFNWSALEESLGPTAPPKNAITSDDFMKKWNCSRENASQRLRQLVAQGLLERVQYKRTFYYTVKGKVKNATL